MMINWRNWGLKIGVAVGVSAVVVLGAALYAYHEWANPIGSGKVSDEAQAANWDATKFKHAGDAYFEDMDNGIQLTEAETRGRIMWLLWTGGNDRFWDAMGPASLGVFDLLKIVTSHPSQTHENQPYTRDSRWWWLGVVNEPCFEKAAGPDPTRFGLWLDARRKDCKADPFADANKYPGIASGARGKNIGDSQVLPVGSIYGEPTGIVGLRLFTNPAFDEEAARKWDPEKYYTDPTYYNDPQLVRPYRVGMACGFCHVGPSPTHPPADPSNPQWADLNATVGAQYLWMDRVFSYNPDFTPGDSNFLDQLLHSYAPGTMDTSLVSTDYIDNPRTMNAVYALGTRLAHAKRWGKQVLQGGELDNKQLPDYFQAPNVSWSPHVLKDGSDTVGALGALNRVYLNIGLFSEEWLTHFLPFFGGKPISPIKIAVAEKNSAYWRATEQGSTDMALYLKAAGRPDLLKDAPGGAEYLATDEAVVARGKLVFADTCARCHSSKLPTPAPGLDPGGCAGPGYLECWKKYWSWTQTESFKAEMRAIASKPDFTEGNFMSNDTWVPATLLRTNICSALATNAIANNIWNDFSSSDYKALPSVGSVSVQDPFTGKKSKYDMPAGGRGYIRPPSLISLWSTAPFFQNNKLGPPYAAKLAYENGDPSVKSRMAIFDDAIHQLLWPQDRKRDALASLDGVVERISTESWLKLPTTRLPWGAEWLLESAFNRWIPFRADSSGNPLVDATGHVAFGPIPPGTPIGLLANMRLVEEDQDSFLGRLRYASKLLDLLTLLRSDLQGGRAQSTIDDARFANMTKALSELSKCPDYVVNRGHYFGTAQFNETDGLTEDEKSFGTEPVLSDDDKVALIEFLKTI